MMQIEFTDRYGGNPPSWLPGCFTCEAMGYYPDMKEGVPIDDIEFVKCPDCHGTGRISWLVTVLRIPRWIWKGLCFARESGLNWEMKAPWMTKREHFVLCLKCAFLVDLGVWKP